MKLATTLAHFVIPQSTNNYKAKLLHLTTINILTLFIIVYQFSISSVTRIYPSILGYAANISPDEVVRLTNERRVAQGLSPLNTNPALSRAALAKGNDMINRDYWAHVAPDGTQPWKFFRDAGYRYKYAGENLARDFTNPASAVEAWMASPSHRQNMLSSKYREIGIAVVEGDLNGVDTTIIVQLFGTTNATQAAVPSQSSVANLQTQAEANTFSAPTPTSEPKLAIKEVTLQTQAASPPSPNNILISPFNVTRTISLVLVGLLMLVIVVDALAISRRKIARVSGRSLAHFAFMAMILAVVIMLKVGTII